MLRAVLSALVGLAVLTGLLTWTYRRLAVATELAPRRRRAVLGVLLAGGAVFVAGAVLLRRGDPELTRPVVWLGMTAVAVGLYLLLGLAALAVAVLVLRLAGRTTTRTRLLRVGTPAVVALALVTTAYGVVAALRPGVETHEVRSPAVPAALDGLRVVLVTDLHVGALHDDDWTRRVVRLVEQQDPDLVVLGGDLVDGSPDDVARYLDPLTDLDAPLGVVGVIGNHELLGGVDEAEEWIAALEERGVDVLANTAVEVAPGLTVAGVHDATGTDELEPDPEAALEGVDPADFLLYVAHEPRQVDDLPDDSGVDLMLAGHTHGGQLWPVHGLVRLADPVVAGQAVVDGVPMVVSRGVGTSGPPVRVLAPPQVDVVVLRRS